MMTARKTLTLTIMGRDYRLAVAPEEEANLRACAELVQSKMQEIPHPANVFPPYSVAGPAALRTATKTCFSAKLLKK